MSFVCIDVLAILISCSLSYLIVRCFAYFYHHFGRWMLNINFFENCCTVICYCDITKTIYEHLIHTSRSQTSTNYFRDQFCCCNVVFLCISAFGLTCAFLQNKHWHSASVTLLCLKRHTFSFHL